MKKFKPLIILAIFTLVFTTQPVQAALLGSWTPSLKSVKNSSAKAISNSNTKPLPPTSRSIILGGDTFDVVFDRDGDGCYSPSNSVFLNWLFGWLY